MKRFLLSLLVVILVCVAWVEFTRVPRDLMLQDGDLIFQTSTSNQSLGVGLASKSFYTHVGILKKKGDGFVVIEANQGVEDVPLSQFIAGGWFGRIAVYRDTALTRKQLATMFAAAKTYYGRPYDGLFLFGNEAIYCSELPYLSFKEAGITIGTVQHIRELDVDNRFTRGLIERRWKFHPECIKHGDDYYRCYQRIMEQTLVTPSSIAADPQFTRVYSNYPL